jgi:hypothetical protein
MRGGRRGLNGMAKLENGGTVDSGGRRESRMRKERVTEGEVYGSG